MDISVTLNQIVMWIVVFL